MPYAAHCFLPALDAEELEREPHQAKIRARRPVGADPVAAVISPVAGSLTVLADELGSTAALREVKHLEPSIIAAFQQLFPDRIVEKNRKHPIPAWSPIGNVDVLVHPSHTGESLIAVELKWCYVDKLYEAIWDLFKMALLSTTGARTYLITGATTQMWFNSIGREIFSDAIHSTTDLCDVRLPWGKKLRAWDDLLWGGDDKCPTNVPSRIRTTEIGRAVVGPAIANGSCES